MVKVILADNSLVDVMVKVLTKISDEQCVIIVKDDPKLPPAMELKYELRKMEVLSDCGMCIIHTDDKGNIKRIDPLSKEGNKIIQKSNEGN